MTRKKSNTKFGIIVLIGLFLVALAFFFRDNFSSPLAYVLDGIGVSTVIISLILWVRS